MKGRENPAEDALILLRSRICNPNFVFTPFSDSPDSNYSKLKFIISSSVTEACNNSILLLGPRGSGKTAVLELVIRDLLAEHADMISVIRLNGLLHSDDNCAVKEIARQLCVEHQLLFSKMASFDDNSQFMIAMLRLLEHIFSLPVDTSLPNDYAVEFNMKLHVSVSFSVPVTGSMDCLCESMAVNVYFILFSFLLLTYHVPRFYAVCHMDLESGFLSLDNFRTAMSSIQRQPKMEYLQAEYKGIHDAYQTSDYYARNVCLRAFEHLVQRELICFMDNRGNNQSIEFRAVKLLISSHELYQGLKSYRSCPVSSYKNSHSAEAGGPMKVIDGRSALWVSEEKVKVAVCTPPFSETHFQDVISKSIREKPSNFSNYYWLSHQFGPVIVDPDLFVRVLSSFRTSPRMALRLFRWAESQPGFRRSEFVFCAILEILAQNNLMRSAYWVMERVINANMHRIVDVLIGGCVSSEVSVKILDLLIWVYSKKSMVEQCLSVFDKMIKSRLSPDVKNCNRILRILRDKDLMSKAVEVYRTMGEFGIKPTIVTYNTLLDSYCKGGKVQQGLDLLSEMQRRGCAPNDVTYNVLINGLSKKGEFEQAKGLIGEMLKTGLKVSAYTYNPLIYGYFNKGLLAEALSLQEEMVLKGASPTVATYNSFIYGLCKLGRMSDAMQQLSDMLANNLLPDVVSYNTLIYGYCRLGNLMKAFLLFDELRSIYLFPTIVTYNTLLDGLCRQGELEVAQQLKVEMINEGIAPDIVTYTILVNGSCKMGSLSMAQEFFDEMLHEGLELDSYAYATRIVGELKLGDTSRAFSLQEEMLAKGFPPDLIIYNVVVDGLCKLGNLEEASELLQKDG
uniref:Origin recognition complex subunit 4 C-terminal domain-containing protein n=1 Tax=Vitis vinifera TaxID=29760 RepID=A5B899_VITVI|nr:hypothetical protein VITISV_043106 [Vitis vinifera]